MNKEKYVELVKQNPCFLDVVYENVKSNSDDWMDNYLLRDNYLKKYLYYRFNPNDGIDIDSCAYLMPIYVVLCKDIFTTSNFVLEKKNSSKKQFELKLEGRSDSFYIRGDTAINAMSAIQQIFEYIECNNSNIENRGILPKPNSKNYRDEDLRCRYKNCVDILEKDYKEIFIVLNEHIRLCYSVGNFYPLMHKYKKERYSLNVEKAKYKLS